MIEIDTLLAYGAAYKKVAAREIIFSEGASCHFYHQLIEGSVRWVNVDDEGREVLQYVVDPGESFGEFPLFDEQPYAASAIAEKDSLVIRLNVHSFKTLLKENPAIHFEFSKLLVQRVRFKFFILKEMAHQNPEHRIVSLLEYFKKIKKYICPKCHKVNLTRQQLADMTGLRVETVIRAMRHLHETEKLTITRGKVYY